MKRDQLPMRREIEEDRLTRIVPLRRHPQRHPAVVGPELEQAGRCPGIVDGEERADAGANDFQRHGRHVLEPKPDPRIAENAKPPADETAKPRGPGRRSAWRRTWHRS